MSDQLLTPPNPARYVVPLLVAGLAALAGVALLVGMVVKGEFLVGIGLSGNLWFVLLLMLGLAAALTIFALFKSHAKYTGKALRGEVELGGPVVVMLAVIVMGFWLVPPPPISQFVFSVFLHGEAGPHDIPVKHGVLWIDMDDVRRTAQIGADGEARFFGIPSEMRDKLVVVGLESDRFQLSDPTTKLNGASVRKTIRPKLLRLVGDVSDQHGRPLAGVQVAIASQRTITDEIGRFELSVPANLPDVDKEIIISAPGFSVWRSQASLGGGRVQVSLTPAH